MPRIKYIDLQLRPATLARIEQANTIIAEYQEQGFDLTLRQLYYQFVARDLIPNEPEEYDKLGAVISDGRLCGLIDWAAIVDRTRNLRSLSHWQGPENIIDACSEQFNIDRWATQPYRIEVWIEKEALVGVIEGVCEELDVPYFGCRGYTSQSEMWAASQRLIKYLGKRHPYRPLAKSGGQIPIILHFGDHDPSGVDMTRDIRDRLQLFVGREVEIRRLALNMSQVEQYNPPPNPAKVKDSRAAVYIRDYGHESWELDALEPRVLAGLIRDEITELLDEDAWTEATEQQDQGRADLKAIAERFDDVKSYLDGADA